MTETIMSVMVNMIDAIIMIWVTKKIYNKDRKLFKTIVSIFVSMVAIISFIPNIRDEQVSIILNILLLLYIMSQFKESLIKSILMYITTVIIVGATNIVTVVIMILITSSIDRTAMMMLQAQFINVCGIVLLLKTIPIQKLYKMLCDGTQVVRIIIVNSFLICLIVVVIWNTDINVVIQNFLTIMIGALVIIFVNYEMIIRELRISIQDEKIEIYHTYIPVLEQLINEVSSTKHDYKNQIQVMSALPVTCNTFEEICEEINKLTSNMRFDLKYAELLNIDNMIVSALLYSKIMQIREYKDIELVITIFNYSIKTNMDEYSLVRILGILIDNAVEAECEQKCIIMKIYEEEDKTAFCFKNKHPKLSDKEMSKMWEKGYSTKHSEDNVKRGYGLNNVRQIVDKYKGDIKVYNEEINGVNYVCFRLVI